MKNTSRSGEAKGPRAVLWDFDGTLVDSRHKNRAITRAIFPRITTVPPDEIPALCSQEAYDAAVSRSSNWRELYIREFGLGAEETDRAGALWEDAQIAAPDLSPLFAGIETVVSTIAEQLPQGIVSQNTQGLIHHTLERAGLRPCFGIIVGHEDVDHDRQKPHPAGLLHCLDELGVEPGLPDAPATVLYVGDHEVDARCAEEANVWLESRDVAVRVVSVGAFYGVPGDTSRWQTRPRHSAVDPLDILDLVRGAGPSH